MKRLLFTIKFYTIKKGLGVQPTGILHSAPLCCTFGFPWYIIRNMGTSSTLLGL
jgi:hypothetical protein